MRRWSRVIAALLLLAAARLPHVGADDAACLPAAIPAVGEHDESQHGFQAAGTAVEDEHCAVCHWSRTLRTLRATLTVAPAEVTPPAPLHRSDDPAILSASLEHLPARAPPSAL